MILTLMLVLGISVLTFSLACFCAPKSKAGMLEKVMQGSRAALNKTWGWVSEKGCPSAMGVVFGILGMIGIAGSVWGMYHYYDIALQYATPIRSSDLVLCLVIGSSFVSIALHFFSKEYPSKYLRSIAIIVYLALMGAFCYLAHNHAIEAGADSEKAGFAMMIGVFISLLEMLAVQVAVRGFHSIGLSWVVLVIVYPLFILLYGLCWVLHELPQSLECMREKNILTAVSIALLLGLGQAYADPRFIVIFRDVTESFTHLPEADELIASQITPNIGFGDVVVFIRQSMQKGGVATPAFF